eukprot:SAG31_NODE_612_length_13548_cov_171.183285_9_plen_119_part_00
MSAAWSDEFVAKLMQNDLSLLTEKQAAMVAYARKLTASPALMHKKDVDKLRKAQLEDREILDLVQVYHTSSCVNEDASIDAETVSMLWWQVVGYYGYANRLVAGLGIQFGVDEGAPGQ